MPLYMHVAIGVVLGLGGLMLLILAVAGIVNAHQALRRIEGFPLDGTYLLFMALLIHALRVCDLLTFPGPAAGTFLLFIKAFEGLAFAGGAGMTLYAVVTAARSSMPPKVDDPAVRNSRNARAQANLDEERRQLGLPPRG